MIDSKISYLEKEYDLSHLNHKDFICEWENKDEQCQEIFSVRVKYSNHCYSITPETPLSTDDVIISQEPIRIFCPDRYRESISLPSILTKLFDKITTKVSLTHVGNYHIYQLYTRLDPNGERRYCIFFSLKRENAVLSNGHIPIKLYVESAYIKNTKVAVKKASPFGVFLSEASKVMSR